METVFLTIFLVAGLTFLVEVLKYGWKYSREYWSDLYYGFRFWYNKRTHGSINHDLGCGDDPKEYPEFDEGGES